MLSCADDGDRSDARTAGAQSLALLGRKPEWDLVLLPCIGRLVAGRSLATLENLLKEVRGA